MGRVMDGRDAKGWLLTRLQRSALGSVQKHRAHSFFARCAGLGFVVMVAVENSWAGKQGRVSQWSATPNMGAKSQRHQLCAQRSLNYYRAHTSRHAHGRTTGTFFHIE